MVMSPMRSVLLLLFVLSLSNAQDTTTTITPSSSPTAGAKISPSPTISIRYDVPSTTPTTTTITRPSTTTNNAPSNAPYLFTSSPTQSQCISNPRWHYEYWEWVGCSQVIKLSLTCDHELVRCGFYGNLGSASDHCCKCNPHCHGQCNEPIQLPPINGDWSSSDCHDDELWYQDNDYAGEGPSGIVIIVGSLIFVCCAIALCHYNSQAQRTARSNRQSTRQTMATRRQQQRETNATSTTNPRLTEEERNHARYELFVTNFLFQTVLPDKSNVTANSLRSSACKPTTDEEHAKEAKDDDDDDDASSADRPPIGAAGQGSLSERLSSWRRPSAKDECCICLECYTIGETICAPITTECDHVFHEGCINEWLKKNDKCPLCRVELLKE